MDFQPINVVELVGTVLGISVALVPVIGLTCRYALKPLVDALVRGKENPSLEVKLLSQRIERLESQLQALEEGAPVERTLALSPPRSSRA